MNRALVLTHKYYGGLVPTAGDLTDYDRESLTEIGRLRVEIEQRLDTFHIRDAQKEAMNMAPSWQQVSRRYRAVETDQDKNRSV